MRVKLFLWAIAGWIFILIQPVQAVDYAPVSLHCLIGASELLIETSNSSNSTSDFCVDIDNTYIGQAPGPTIRVQGMGKWFIETPLASVKHPESVLLFLEKHAATGEWSIAGPDGQGRIIVQGDFVYFAGLQVPTEWAAYPLTTQNLQRWQKTEFINAVQDIARCFSWLWQPSGLLRAKPVCTSEERTVLAAKSELYKFLQAQLAITRPTDGIRCIRRQ